MVGFSWSLSRLRAGDILWIWTASQILEPRSPRHVICRDRIVIGIKSNDIRKELLNEQKLTLDMCINVYKAMESSSSHSISLKLESVNKVQDGNPKREGVQSSPRVPAAHKLPAARPPTQIATDTQTITSERIVKLNPKYQ